MPTIGPIELAIVLVVALIIFGPKKLPTLGKSLGQGMREFKQTISGESTPEPDAKIELAKQSGAAPDPAREAHAPSA